MDRVRRYLNTPQGHETVEKAKRMAKDPRNRDKVRGLLARFRARGH
ncbi:hypothetical protein Misp01_41830 [Microtetraspora sp. NBRC 13810]|nr:hypothetical protein Misp01_41830 [Microtetraspora sp. NBRC 13810]